MQVAGGVAPEIALARQVEHGLRAGCLVRGQPARQPDIHESQSGDCLIAQFEGWLGARGGGHHLHAVEPLAGLPRPAQRPGLSEPGLGQLLTSLVLGPLDALAALPLEPSLPHRQAVPDAGQQGQTERQGTRTPGQTQVRFQPIHMPQRPPGLQQRQVRQHLRRRPVPALRVRLHTPGRRSR
ncbi:MAG: hypothetical protein M5U12_05025 [Verrucomicrobia bacterium]|nr:hypothetical protein [Verrucomicrobiota bacterium]